MEVWAVVDKSQTLLGQCMLRASVERARGQGIDVENAPKPKKRQAYRLVTLSSLKATRVASFVVLWALALDDLDVDELTLTEWKAWANESERTAWRYLAEFRELFPEFETPTPLALQLRRQMRRRKVGTTAAMNLPVTV
jgi:ferric-dicitrate binding protein FerR (iron transport regulator)